MKQNSFTLNNKELLLVELPEGAKDIDIHYNSDLKIHQLFWRAEFMGMKDVGALRDLPDGEWKLIGKLPEVTEEQYHELVHFFIYEDEIAKENIYRDYSELGFYDTAKESFFSALTASGIFFKNPLPDPELTMRQGNGSVYYGASDEEFEEYAKMEEKVFNIQNTYLFEKV